ncbi:MAG: helix-turn-helix transcriptional regulator [Bacteroidota bacterium]
MKKKDTMTLEEFKDQHYGENGTPKRDELEEGYQVFKIGALIQEARKAKGLTQQQLAEKVGMTNSYISKIENDVKEARLSTLQKIVKEGLDSELQLSIKI